MMTNIIYIIIINIFILILANVVSADDYYECSNFYHHPISIHLSNTDNIEVIRDEILNALEKNNKDPSSSKNKNCIVFGSYRNSPCMNLVKFEQRQIENKRFFFLFMTHPLEWDQQMCWSKNKADCYTFSDRHQRDPIGILSFQLDSGRAISSSGISSICTNIFSDDQGVKFLQTGKNTYAWAVETFDNGQGYDDSAAVIIPAFNNDGKSRKSLLSFGIDHSNSATNDDFIRRDEIKYKFLLSEKQHFDLSFEYSCRKRLSEDGPKSKEEFVKKYKRKPTEEELTLILNGTINAKKKISKALQTKSASSPEKFYIDNNTETEAEPPFTPVGKPILAEYSDMQRGYIINSLDKHKKSLKLSNTDLLEQFRSQSKCILD